MFSVKDIKVKKIEDNSWEAKATVKLDSGYIIYIMFPYPYRSGALTGLEDAIKELRDVHK